MLPVQQHIMVLNCLTNYTTEDIELTGISLHVHYSDMILELLELHI